MMISSEKVTIDTKDVELNEAATKRLNECITFLDALEDVEERRRLLGTLQYAFDMLHNIGVNSGEAATLGYDFAPLSFTFRAGGLMGGLIFHGPCDGSAPNFCVSIETHSGWLLHT